MNNYTITYKKLITTIILITSLVVNAQHESIVKVQLSDQIKKSSQIVEGKVISQSSFWDDNYNHIYTKHLVDVHKVFKGNFVDTVEIITEGGVVDLEAEVVSHSLKLRNGDVGLFLLKGVSDSNLSKGSKSQPSFKAVDRSQGFYKYDLNSNHVANRFNTFKDITTTFYNEVKSITKQSPLIVKDLMSVQKTTTQSKTEESTATLTSFTATNYSAGTKSVLTIQGTGFGTTQGSVEFSDADYGGYLYFKVLDSQILSWSDTKIEVEIPDSAGTGKIKVNSVENGTIISTDKVVIDYAEINLDYNGEAYQTQHVAKNGNGGYTWLMNDEFYNSDAKEPFTRALNSWKCGTGINWEISSELTYVTQYNNYDQINTITFSDNLGGSTLGKCYSRYSGCSEGNQIKWYVVEMDIVFNKNINWNYSTNPPTKDQIDFESVTVHELGHGHQLGHVVNTDVIMHYSLSAGESLRTLTSEDVFGGQDVQSRSTSGDLCGELSMVSASCALLDNEYFEINSQINMYPNPASGQFFIKNNENLDIIGITVYNMQGRRLINLRHGLKNTIIPVDISNLTSGLYLVTISGTQQKSTKKLLVR